MSANEERSRSARRPFVARLPEALRLEYLAAMGISVFVPRERAAVSTVDSSDERAASLPPTTHPHGAVTTEMEMPKTGPSDVDSMPWDPLRDAVASCTLCELHSTRTHTVFGVGNPEADLMIIGEAPGAEEDRQGEPFVGAAGQLLNAMLGAIGLAREQVFIANILKCRPPRNRDPKPEEADRCRPYLMRQVELVQPGLILALGRIAAQDCLATDKPLGQLRGKVFHFGPGQVPLLATYHPAYLLRKPSEKRKSWQDLKLAQVLLRKSS